MHPFFGPNKNLEHTANVSGLRRGSGSAVCVNGRCEGRSAWEDSHQQQRQLIAGKGGDQVQERRKDDEISMFFTAKEGTKSSATT